jgi:thioredoxin 1
MIIELDTKTYDNYIKENKQVLLDFSATWCGPCRMSYKELEKLDEKQESVKIAKIDIDNASELAEAFSVSVVPTMILIQDGIEVKRTVGAVNLAALESFIKD